MANKTIRDFHGSFNVSESYTTYKSEDQIDEATPPSGPKNPDKPHVGKTAHEKKVERYQQYLAKKKRDREQHLRNNPGLKQGGERRRIQPNAFYSKRAFRNQEINASFDPDLSEADKSEYSKLMKQYGDMPMSKVPMKTRMRIRELGRKVRGDKSVSGLRASDLVDDMKRRQMGEAKSDRLEKIARAAAAREKDQAAQKEKAKQKHYAASKKSREAVKHFGNKDQFGRVREDIEQVDENRAQSMTNRAFDKVSREKSSRSDDEFEVKYAKSRRGPIQVSKFGTLNAAKGFLAAVKKKGMNGIISKGGKPVREEVEQVDEISVKKKAQAYRKMRDRQADVSYNPHTGKSDMLADTPEKKRANRMLKRIGDKHGKDVKRAVYKSQYEEIEQVAEAGMIGRTKPSRELNIQ